ncbi:hypothetical protein BS78_06G295300 [Paspalum vaginatum]|nr:hypothetical protein BS78_06G295300 [Paspalum vaginatum]
MMRIEAARQMTGRVVTTKADKTVGAWRCCAWRRTPSTSAGSASRRSTRPTTPRTSSRSATSSSSAPPAPSPRPSTSSPSRSRRKSQLLPPLQSDAADDVTTAPAPASAE